MPLSAFMRTRLPRDSDRELVREKLEAMEISFSCRFRGMGSTVHAAASVSGESIKLCTSVALRPPAKSTAFGGVGLPSAALRRTSSILGRRPFKAAALDGYTLAVNWPATLSCQMDGVVYAGGSGTSRMIFSDSDPVISTGVSRMMVRASSEPVEDSADHVFMVAVCRASLIR